MTVELITAIAALVAASGGIISAIMMNRKTAALLEYRMSEVERKLDVHNGYAERLTGIEKALVAMQKDIEYIAEKEKAHERLGD